MLFVSIFWSLSFQKCFQSLIFQILFPLLNYQEHSCSSVFGRWMCSFFFTEQIYSFKSFRIKIQFLSRKLSNNGRWWKMNKLSFMVISVAFLAASSTTASMTIHKFFYYQGNGPGLCACFRFIPTFPILKFYNTNYVLLEKKLISSSFI